MASCRHARKFFMAFCSLLGLLKKASIFFVRFL